MNGLVTFIFLATASSVVLLRPLLWNSSTAVEIMRSRFSLETASRMSSTGAGSVDALRVGLRGVGLAGRAVGALRAATAFLESRTGIFFILASISAYEMKYNLLRAECFLAGFDSRPPLGPMATV